MARKPASTTPLPDGPAAAQGSSPDTQIPEPADQGDDTASDWSGVAGHVPPSADESLSGTISGYRLIRELGAGGMGTVYEAEQVALGRRVALKVLPSSMGFSSRAVRRFRREAEAGGRQRHPGIVSVYDVGEADGVHFIAQELVEGGRTLSDALHEARQQPQLPANYYRRTARLFIEIAQALQHAHDSGVVHLDIKPSNILLERGGRPKVADFGVARVENALGLSQTGQFAGTPFYMSPEQVTGRIGLDNRSDIFSLGATLYEALSFRRAFDGDTSRQVMEKILLESPPDPQLQRSLLPRDLAAICLQALEKNRERRYASMADLAEDLARFLEGEPVTARPPGRLRRARMWLRRHPVLGASGAVAAAAFVVVAGLLFQLREKNLALDRQNAALEAEAATARTALDFMVELFESSDPDQSRGAELTVKEVLDRGAVRIGSELQPQPAVRARLMQAIGGVYLSLGQYDQAQALLEETLEVRLEALGAQHAEAFQSMTDLALLYQQQGRLDKAEALFIEAVTGCREHLGSEHPDCLNAINDLAVLFWEQGRYDEAEPLSLQALQGRRQVLGRGHEDTLKTANNLAMLYQGQGRYGEAEPLMLEILEGKRRVLGFDHPSTLFSVNNLAGLFRRQGRYGEAEPLYLEAVRGKRRVLGDDHPSTLYTTKNLALVRHRQGQLDQAQSLYREAWQGMVRVLGPDHPDTLNAQRCLAELLGDLGQLEEAAPLLERAWGAQRRLLGDAHPATLASLSAMGNLRAAQGQAQEAEDLHQRALTSRRQALGAEHPHTLDSLADLAQLHLQSGRPQEAEALLEQVLAGRRSALGPEHPDTLAILVVLAERWESTGCYQQAEPLALELMRRTSEDDARYAERKALLERIRVALAD